MANGDRRQYSINSNNDKYISFVVNLAAMIHLIFSDSHRRRRMSRSYFPSLSKWRRWSLISSTLAETCETITECRASKLLSLTLWWTTTVKRTIRSKSSHLILLDSRLFLSRLYSTYMQSKHPLHSSIVNI